MKNILFVLLNLLLALGVVAPLHAQPLLAGRCHEGQTVYMTHIVPRLGDGAEVMLVIEEEARVLLSSDTVGKTFTSQGTVTLHVTSQEVSQPFSGPQVPAPDVTPLLAVGENHLRITAPTGELVWLFVFSPCPIQASEAGTILPAPASEETVGDSRFRAPTLDPGQPVATAPRVALRPTATPTALPTATETPLPTATSTATPWPTATMTATPTRRAVAAVVSPVPPTGIAPQSSLDETPSATGPTELSRLQMVQTALLAAGLLLLGSGALLAGWRVRQRIKSAVQGIVQYLAVRKPEGQ